MLKTSALPTRGKGRIRSPMSGYTSGGSTTSNQESNDEDNNPIGRYLSVPNHRSCPPSNTYSQRNQPRSLSVSNVTSLNSLDETGDNELLRHSFDEALQLPQSKGLLVDTSKYSASSIQTSRFVTEQPRHIFRACNTKSFCQVCRRRGGFKTSYNCAVCRYSVHEGCLKYSKQPCVRTCTLYPTCPTTAERNQTLARTLTHQWVAGDFKQTKCALCNRACGSSITKLKFPAELRCVWCKRVVHPSCLRMEADHVFMTCDMGRFRALTLSPNELHMTMDKTAEPEDVDSSQPSLHSIPDTCTSYEGLDISEMEDEEREGEGEGEDDDEVPSTFRPPKPLHLCDKIKITAALGKTPLLVFVNPKSGGNQGLRILRKMQWLLNPWQVFDLRQGGPEIGLRMFSNVPGLIILVAGGDGTVGWVLSQLDKNPLVSPAPVVILPLGTGNDLARVLRWGGGYTNNQSLTELLLHIQIAEEVYLDRWSVTSTALQIPIQNSWWGKEDSNISLANDLLPVNVMNNYFSIGADANAVLAFHLAREHKPGRFNSRWGNKLYYGMEGGKQILFKSVCKEMYKHVSLICDGEDYNKVITEQKLQGIIFLNISSYAGGTNPWGWKKGDMRPQIYDDGYLEVLGVNSIYQLAKQQVGIGRCVRICQCRQATLVTQKAFPLQIDGEPCLLVPSTITLNYFNKAPLLARSVSKESLRLSNTYPMNRQITCHSQSKGTVRLKIPSENL